MTEQTLKYKHQISCSGNKAKTNDIQVEQIQDIEDINVEPPPMPPLKRSTTQCAMTVRQNKIKAKARTI